MITNESLGSMVAWKFDALFRALIRSGFHVSKTFNRSEMPGQTALMFIGAMKADKEEIFKRAGIEDEALLELAYELVPGFYIVSEMDALIKGLGHGSVWAFWHEKLADAEADYFERTGMPSTPAPSASVVDAVPIKTDEVVGLEDVPEPEPAVCQLPDCGCNGLAHP